MRRITLLASLACLAALYACDDVARSYRTCPPGVSPTEFDCIPPTTVGDDVGGVDVGPVDLDTAVSVDASPGDASVADAICVPDCSGRECGSDGCGGVCGTCDRGSACSGGECVPRTTPGEFDCGGIIECVQECRTEECWERCISQGDPVAQDEFIEILVCLDEECARFEDDEDRYQQCQEEQCGDVIRACYGVDTGTRSCGESFECIAGCSDQGCVEECYFDATAGAQSQLDRLFACTERRCSDVGSPEEWFECAQDACAEPFDDCFDRLPPDPEGACSPRDWARLEEIGEEIGIFIMECGFSCEGSDEPDACASTCMQSQLGTSNGCSGCLGDFSMCAVDECRDVCLDPFSEDCEECADDACTDEFDACAGGF